MLFMVYSRVIFEAQAEVILLLELEVWGHQIQQLTGI